MLCARRRESWSASSSSGCGRSARSQLASAREVTAPRPVRFSRTLILAGALLLVLGTGACAKACNGKSRADAGLPDAAGEDPRVEMLSTGREPRVRLEVARWTG